LTTAQTDTLRAALHPYPQAPEPQGLETYRRFFALDFVGCDYQSGTVPGPQGQNVFMQTFAVQPRGGVWVILAHGYLEHAGLNPRAVAYFLGKGWNVAVLDLPGHGLSDGRRGFIEDFDQYGDVVEQVHQAVVKRYRPESWVPCGFSAGCASLMNWMLRYQPQDVKAIVFFSPLIRSYLWDLSQMGLALVSWAMKTVPNRPRADSTTNLVLADLLENRDPLRINYTDLGWAQALGRWVKRLREVRAPVWTGPVLVCQGGQDTVVDSSYNLGVIQKLFPGPRVESFPTLKHSLLDEPGSEGDRVYSVLTDFLFSKSPLSATL